MPAGNPYGSCDPRRGGSGSGKRNKIRGIFSHRDHPTFWKKTTKTGIHQPPPQDEVTRLLMMEPVDSITTSHTIAAGGKSHQKTKKSPARNNKKDDDTLLVADYALEFANICRAAMIKRNIQLIVWNTLTLILTIFAVSAAVLYGHIYGNMPAISVPAGTEDEESTILATVLGSLGLGGEEGSSIAQWVLYSSTILLPVGVAWVIKSRFDFVKRGDPFSSAFALVESEIFKFRTRVPPYKKHVTAENNLMEKLQEIYQTHIIEKGHTLDLEEERFWNLDDVDEKQVDVPSANTLPPKEGLNHQHSQKSTISPTTILEEFEQTSYATLPYIPGGIERNGVADLEAPALSPSGGVKQPVCDAGEKTRLVKDDAKTDDKHNRSTDRKPNAAIDDGRSELSPNHYVVLRLQNQLQKQSKAVDNLSKQKVYLEGVSRLLTLSTGILAIVSYQWIVPIVFAVAAAVLQVVDFASLDQKCQRADTSCQQLNQIQKWWNDSVNIQDQKWELRRLVQETEAAIVCE